MIPTARAVAATRPLKVLIVDDSPFMRTVLRQIIAADPAFRVVGEVGDGVAALDALRQLTPDIVTLDVEMPALDGIGVLRQAQPRAGRAPVFIMVSAFTTAGAALTLSALQAGALDFVPKASENFNVDLAKVGRTLREKLAAAAAVLGPGSAAGAAPAPVGPAMAPPGAGPMPPGPVTGMMPGTAAAPPRSTRGMTAPSALRDPGQGGLPGIPTETRPGEPRPGTPGFRPRPAPFAGIGAPLPTVSAGGPAPDLVVVASSTGGPQTLPLLLAGLSRYPAPIVIAQHIPPLFSGTLAQSLTRADGLPCREAEDGMVLLPGTVHILPGGQDGEVVRGPGGTLALRIGPPTDGGFHPNGDLLFRSAALTARRPVGVILTGMGHDGSDGAAALVRRGRPVLVQDPETALLWGMPRAAISAGVASIVLPVEGLAAQLMTLAGLDGGLR
ncbi:MAG: hypothetical protein RLY86_1653 [Pseudomonadota bacterium]|jgi:two-component system chemotaxis response regulator CheB